MTFYPSAIDDDRSIIRIDDNLSELGTLAINQLRAAVFAIEKELGTTPSGSKSSVDDRISVSLNEDGTIKSSALESAGLVSLPIVDSHIATNAGIKESKLDLNVSTLDLQAQIDSISIVSNNTAVLATETNADLLGHISGVLTLSDGSTAGRHVASQIDLNSVPFDTRDATFIWTGLLDKSGNLRSATNVASGLLQVNNALTSHENATSDAHPASAISVFTDDWTEIPSDSESVQDVLDFFDDRENLSAGLDRAILNSNGIIRNARAERIGLDGYNYEVIPVTKVRAFLAEPNQTQPRDSISNGDDVITFVPEDNSDFSFDTAFTQVQVGDIVRIDYGSGIAGMFTVRSVRFTPGTDWTVRIDGFNLDNRDGDVDGYAYARIDRRRHDINTQGVLAVAAAHADVTPDACGADVPDSVVIGSPRGAMALGLGFDVGALNSSHYNLWLRLYPGGDPSVFKDLFAIDVTGNMGATPGTYSINSVVEATNTAFRSAGYNYRFIAFEHDGEFGIMLADSWNNASFSIISGSTDGASLTEGIYLKNVIGDATDGYDALGFGSSKAAVASPVHISFSSSLGAANFPTIIHSPTRGRHYLADGTRRDTVDVKSQTIGDGYWVGTISSNFTDIPNGTITSTYRIPLILRSDELKYGKTLVVQPVGTPTANVTGYGRFIIGSVLYNENDGYTDITVINSSHATANALGAVLSVGTSVKIYFTEDSVGFNRSNLQSQGTYHRYHEIYVDGNGKTSPVERARVEKQSADLAKINTDRDNWIIKNVSSKMKGYRVDDSFRRWLRLYIIGYDTGTGEFDGYVGEPTALASTGILNPGPIVRGTKNTPVRFYDNTHVNFIDVEFKETFVDPGTDVVSSTPVFMDIEIFPSFSTNDAEFRLAGVSHNEKTISSIADLREFGTLSEENFTDSAISFIEAGERYLHANGVVRGFEYIGAGSNQAVLNFSGGIALINGSFVLTDLLTCTIPEIKDSTTTLDFFICLTQDGTLKAIPENVGTQFFEATSGEFIESFTFDEIVDNHKELLVISVVTAVIGSLQVSDITDARRFVTNESINGFSLSVAREGEPQANNASFHSFEAAETWITRYGIKQIFVKNVVVESLSSFSATSGVPSCELIGGTWTIENTLSLTDLKIKQAVINISGLKGINLSTNAHLETCEISYNTTLTPTFVTNDKVNVGDGYYGIDIVSGNASIVDCSFSSTASQRAPFIFAETGSGFISNVIIKDNEFSDGGLADNSAICFRAVGGPSTFAYLYNVIIDNNVCTNQNIILAGDQSGTNNYGWGFSNVHVTNNKCGIIGYWGHGEVDSDGLRQSLEISGNTCRHIIRSRTDYAGTGHRSLVGPLAMSAKRGGGHILIKNNNITGNIDVACLGSDGTATRHGSLCVESNAVYVQFGSLYNNWNNNIPVYVGIQAFTGVGNASNPINSDIKISSNTIYVTGSVSGQSLDVISAAGTGSITDNLVSLDSGLLWGTIVLLAAIDETSSNGSMYVSGNRLLRNGTTIANYINVTGYDLLEVVDNILDGYLVDSSNVNSWTDAIIATVAGGASPPIVERNKNHRQSITVNYSGRGIFTDGYNTIGGTNGTLNSAPIADIILSPDAVSGLQVDVTLGAGLCRVNYYLPLQAVLPSGVGYLISVSSTVSVENTADWAPTSAPTLFILKEGGIAGSYSDSIDITSVLSKTLTATNSTPIPMSDRPLIDLLIHGINDAGASIEAIRATELTIVYQW